MGSNNVPRLGTLGVLALAATPAWGYGGGYHHGPGMMYGGGWGGGIFGWLMMFLAIVLVVALVIGVLRWIFGSRHLPVPTSPTQHKVPLDILEERFARGEIDKDEFAEKRSMLSK